MKSRFEIMGEDIRKQTRELVMSFMQQSEACQPSAECIKQAELFRVCGLDWGEQPTATSTQQNFWLVGLLRTLESEGIVERDVTTKKWRLK